MTSEIIEISIEEIADAYQTYESLWDLFTEKLEEKRGEAFSFFQPFGYTVVGIGGDNSLQIQIEGHDEGSDA